MSAPAASLSDLNEPGAIKATPWAWGLCWLMFAGTVLNYMDRQAMALVSSKIKGEFHVGNEGFGWVLAAFQLSYAFWQVPAGYLTDRLNLRWAYAGAVAWWSLAGVIAAFSPTLGILMACRALLGVGEAFNWPCGLRVTAQVLPPADRTLGNGIFNSGAAVGAVLTPLIVTPIAAWYGWRKAFVFVGCLGFVWVVSWISALSRSDRARMFAGRASTRVPEEDALGSRPSGLSPQARGLFGGVVALSALMACSAWWLGLMAIWWAIATLMIGVLLAALVLPMHELKGADWAESLGEVVRLRVFWVLAVGSISINICWHFLVNWLPTYLKEDRGMSFLAGGLWSAVPFLAADFGNLGGGAFSRFLAQRGMPPARARFWTLAVCSACISTGLLVTRVPSNTACLALLGVMAFGAAAYMANGFAFCQEVNARHTGLIVGILGGLANLFVAGSHPLAGMIRDRTGGFGPVFAFVALAPLVGLIVLYWGWEQASSSAGAGETATVPDDGEKAS